MSLVNPPVASNEHSCEKSLVDGEQVRDEKEQTLEPIQGRCCPLQRVLITLKCSPHDIHRPYRQPRVEMYI